MLPARADAPRAPHPPARTVRAAGQRPLTFGAADLPTPSGGNESCHGVSPRASLACPACGGAAAEPGGRLRSRSRPSRRRSPGERRRQARAGRWAPGGAARPPIPRLSGSAARLRASLRPRGEGSGHVPFRSSATHRQVPQAPLGGAGAARGGGPAAFSFRARAPVGSDPGRGAAPQQEEGIVLPTSKMKKLSFQDVKRLFHNHMARKWQHWD
ncbi:uncharacterized protein LOC115305294 [Suricata suricatta]|uniref:uncharacterized protein LOC115305294 n=1 Tax=Suricata suricatta TaxID=37032 RepID=UPI001155C3BF|nr:uncharacterized protein LOC115305294 [Suricata suricatta]